MFPHPDTYDPDEITELIEARYQKIIKNYYDRACNTLSEETKEES